MAARKVSPTPSTPVPASKPATKSTARGRSSNETVTTLAAAKASETPKRSKAARAAAVAAPTPAPARAAPPPTVTLKQLAAQLAEAHAMSRKQSESVLAELVSAAVEHLKAGDRLRLQGLGTLEVRHRPARQGRNPATGESIQIAASKTVAFRPAKELKEAV